MQTHHNGFYVGVQIPQTSSMNAIVGFNVELKLQDWFLKLEKCFSWVVTIGSWHINTASFIP